MSTEHSLALMTTYGLKSQHTGAEKRPIIGKRVGAQATCTLLLVSSRNCLRNSCLRQTDHRSEEQDEEIFFSVEGLAYGITPCFDLRGALHCEITCNVCVVRTSTPSGARRLPGLAGRADS